MAMNIRYHKRIAWKFMDGKRDKPRCVGIPIRIHPLKKIRPNLAYLSREALAKWDPPQQLPKWFYVFTGIAAGEGIERLHVAGKRYKKRSEGSAYDFLPNLPPAKRDLALPDNLVPDTKRHSDGQRK